MKTKVLVVICIILFMFGCSEKQEPAKKVRRRGKRITSSKKIISLENRIANLESQIEQLTHKQARLVMVVDFHSGEIYKRIEDVEYFHSGSAHEKWLENWTKEKWIKAVWELDSNH